MSDPPSITVIELARRLDGAMTGDGARAISAVATLEEAGPDALSWAATPDLMPRAQKSKAGVLLIPEDCSLPADRTVIRVADPDVAVCEVLAYLAPPTERVPAGVDPAATVGAGAVVEGAAIGAHVWVGSSAVIGAGTQLHPGVYVGSHARIGRDCVLWPNVVVRERVNVGDRVIIHPNATIGADGFGYLQRGGKHRKIPQIGTVVIEDDVEIGANSTIDRARSGVTRIGRGTKIDNLVQIGHNVEMGEDCIIVGLCGLGGSCTLGRHVIIGGHSGIFDHCRIGSGVQIAAKSCVTRHVPDGQTLRGNPATDSAKFLREQAHVRKLPKWIQELRALTQRVQRLEEQGGDEAQP